MVDLFQEFYALHPKRQRFYKEKSRRHIIKAPYLLHEMIGMLLRTNGEMSYKTMEEDLGGVVSLNVIQRNVKSLEGFKHWKIRLLTHLNNASKEKRGLWDETLWFFWKSAKYVVPQVKFVLYCMDEKWFYVVFNHTMDKVVTSIGLEPVEHHVHQNSHV